MAEVSLKAERREALGRKQVKKLRRLGKVPGVVYGRRIEAAIPITLDAREVYHLTHGSHGGSLESIVISLEIEAEGKTSKHPTLIKELQMDAIQGTVLHIDLNEISLTEKIHTRVPVFPKGECKGEKMGGILEQVFREIEIACLPGDLPEEIIVDVSDLGPHDSIKVGDLNMGDRVEVLTDKNQPVFTVIVPRLVAAEAEEAVAGPVAGEGTEEPEVIGEKKGEQEAEAPEGGAKKKK
ncbi:MAG: 50S ribosomal protein L25 [Verrucomicrobia bacterium]|nr:50S ribosomal protein L25 [Verrucomicrobiota bacterium]